MSTSTTEPTYSRASAKKRKTMASATSTSMQSHNAKRIKPENASITQSKISKPVSTIADSMYDAIVTIKVGETAKTFTIHRGLLRRASKFFREELALCETTELGVVAEVMAMKEESPETFRRFNDWLYTGTIILESETCKSLAWSDLIAVYAFAERRGVPRLQNNCVDTLIEKRKQGGLFPAQTDVNTLWKAPGNVFRLRRLLLETFATGCNLKHAIANNGHYHPRFLQELVQILYDMKQKGTIYDEVDFWERRQDYYVDDDENRILLD